MESTPGLGTTFTVQLPLGQAHLPPAQVVEKPVTPRLEHAAVFLEESLQWLAETPIISAALPVEPGAEPTAAATILMVDDNADMRAYVQRILSHNPHWTIQVATDGEQALKMIGEHLPDLVLSDVMMPRLDGFGLLHALKQRPYTAPHSGGFAIGSGRGRSHS